MEWARTLAYITGTVDQELLLRNEYLATENRILKAQSTARLLLSDAEKKTLADIAYRLGRNPQSLDVWHGSNLEWIEYAVEIPHELLSLWDDAALHWAEEVSDHPAVVDKVARYVAIHQTLKCEPRGPRRSALVDESFALKRTTIL